MKKPKVLVSIADGFHWKYLYETGVIGYLLKKEFNVVILISEKFERYLSETPSENENLQIIFIKEWMPHKLTLFLTTLFPLLNRKYTQTENFQREEFNKRFSFRARFIVSEIAKIRFINNFLLSVLKRFLINNQMHAIVCQENPDMIITSTPGQKIFDIPVLISAAKLKIETFCPVYSWDNLTSKGNIVFKPTYLAVWNKPMVNEAVELHGYNINNIFKLGSPTFEGYFSEDRLTNEPLFVRNHFKNKAITSYVLVTTVPVRFYGYEHINLVNSINDILKNSNLINVGILVRVHPMDHTDYSVFTYNDRIFIDYYGSEKAKSRETALDQWFPIGDNISHLKRTIVNASVCINVASTISLEASLCGKTVLNIAYFKTKNSYADFGDPSRFYRYTHYQPVIKNNLAKVISSEVQLGDALIKVLNCKSSYNNQISLRAKEFLGANGKKSALLIANKIVELVYSQRKSDE